MERPESMAARGRERAPEASASSLDGLMAVLGREIEDTWHPETVTASQPSPPAGEIAVQFSCAGRRWAVPTRAIVEVRELPPVSVIPFAPPWLRGVARAGGEVVAVVDLALFLSARLAPEPVAAVEAEPVRESLVVVRSAGKEISAGLAIRGKARLAALADVAPEAPPGAELPRSLHWVTAGLRRGAGGEIVALLDVDRLLRAARAELG